MPGLWRCMRCSFVNRRTDDDFCGKCGKPRYLSEREAKYDWPWGIPDKADLSLFNFLSDTRRIVACVSVYNDTEALVKTAHTWLPHVDHIILATGKYNSRKEEDPEPYLQVLKGPSIQVVKHANAGDQQFKRSALLASMQPGDIGVMIDADEFIFGLECLRRAPYFDVGWVRAFYPDVYTRWYNHPHVFRYCEGLHYGGNHYSVYAGHSRLASHQLAGPGYIHRRLPIAVHNMPKIRNTERMRERQKIKAARHEELSSELQLKGKTTREALRILQMSVGDPGGVVYRLHTALNTCTPHSSIYFQMGGDNKFDMPTQYAAVEDQEILKVAYREADIIHNHVYHLWANDDVVPGARVMHHHGTVLRKDRGSMDAGLCTMQFISNLELRRYLPNAVWLPNPIPCGEYGRLAQHIGRGDPRSLVIGHSPSKPEIKGTAEFLRVVERLKNAGHAITLELITGMSHREALERKARCDIFFDSFDLGIQCSGLEAVAMGVPVIAGDHFVAARYKEEVGYVPYIFAPAEQALFRVLEEVAVNGISPMLIGDSYHYVATYHDYPMVAKRYLEALDQQLSWSIMLQPKQR